MISYKVFKVKTVANVSLIRSKSANNKERLYSIIL